MLIESKTIKNVDVIIAIDIANNKTNIKNIKSMLMIFDSMVKDYNCNGHVLLSGDDIVLEFDIEDIKQLDNFILPQQTQANYNAVFKYAKNKQENENWNIFKIYYITDGDGIFPERSEIDTIWVTTNNNIGNFPFGQVLPINI